MRRAFRPSVQEVESRLMPSGAGRVAAFAATGVYGQDFRLGLHEVYLAEAQQGPTRIVFLGDSITYLWGERNPNDPGGASWAAKFAPLGARDFGIPGDLTENLIWRLRNGELAGRPKVAVVLIGINDLIAGRGPATTARHITDVTNTITKQSPKTKILLIKLMPTTNPDLNLKIEQVNKQLDRRRLGPDVTVEAVSDLLVKPDGSARQVLFGPGGIHPTPAGYAKLAKTLRPAIRQLLRSR